MPKSRGRKHGNRRPSRATPQSFDGVVIKLAGRLLVDSTTRVEAEETASQVLGAALVRERTPGARDAPNQAAQALVAAAERRSNASAAALVAALDLIIDDPAIDEALASWAAPHLVDLPWHEAPPAELVRTRRLPDQYDDHVTWLLEFEDATLAATTARWYHQAVLHVFVLPPGPLKEFDALAKPVPVDEALVAVAAGQLHTEMYWPPHDDDDYRPIAQMLASRLSRLDIPDEDRDWEPISDEAHRDLLDRFLTDLDVSEDTQAEVRRLADICIDYGDGMIDDDRLAWSPEIVEAFLLDWVPRKTFLAPEDRRRLPQVTHDFVGWALVQRGIPRNLAADCARVALDLEEEFLGEYDDEGSAAAELHDYLRDNGVDLEDSAAVERAVSAFNASRLARIIAGK
jgi:hypothetical protein